MQNRSTAVMQRRAPAPDALEYFPTQPWATRALCEFLLAQGEDLGDQTAWEPACGEMHMAKPLGEYFARVEATDVHRYTPDHGICDFLMEEQAPRQAHWIVSNPPFKLGGQFIETALRRSLHGVAMLVRSAFTEGDERHQAIYERHPPAFVLQPAERVVMLQGRLIRTGAPDPFNLDEDAKPKKASTATSYCWLIWIKGETDTRHRWIPKCRTRLERDSDYPEYAEQWAAIGANKGSLL